MRWLIVKKECGTVANIIESEDAPEAEGCHCFPAVTGTEAPGDVIDIATAAKARQVDAMCPVVFSELLRLTNEVRAIRNEPARTADEYRAALTT